METLASPPTSTSTSSAPSEYTRFRACDECRRRKIKCDGRVSGCRHCLNSVVPCVYNNPTRTNRKRATSSQKIASDPEATVNLEERLERIERAVKEHLASRLPPTPQDARGLATGMEDSVPSDASESEVRPANPNPSKSKERALYLWKITNEDSIRADGGLISDFQGKLRFIGESSVFSLFLPRGMQWVCEKIGESHFSDPLKPDVISEWKRNPPENALINISGECNSRAAFFEGAEAPLPARHVVWKYINDYFDRFNYTLPIFNREKFNAEIGLFYQNGSRASPAWLMAFYVILALGCASNPIEESAAIQAANQAQALALFRTGCRNVPTVLFCNRDTCGIQALLVAVLFLWDTTSSEGCFTLLGVATSIGSEIGLHRCGTQLGLGPQEVELRQNLFWVAYVLDKEVSLRIGRPSSIVDNDTTVKLPQANMEGISRLFYHRVRLARILSKVSTLLCSQVSTKLPGDALLGTIKMLDTQLEEWRSACEVIHGTLRGGDPNEALQTLQLTLVYFSCLSAIKRPLSPAFDLQEGNNLDNPSLSKGFESCLLAARASIRLIDRFEQHNLKMLRSTAVYLVGAAVTLFTNILDNPLSQSAAEDMPYLQRASEYLKDGLEKGCSGSSEMFFLTYTLYSMASQTVARLQAGVWG